MKKPSKITIRADWWETQEGKSRLALENKALQEKFPGIHARPKFVTYGEIQYLGFEAVLTTNFEGTVKKLKIFIRYPPGYPKHLDNTKNSIKTFPLEILDENDQPTGEELNPGENFHRWGDGRLCLWYTGEGGANIKVVSIVGIVAWAATWWWAYNYKVKYGKWPANEK